jgi:hypothetical protein
MVIARQKPHSSNMKADSSGSSAASTDYRAVLKICGGTGSGILEVPPPLSGPALAEASKVMGVALNLAIETGGAAADMQSLESPVLAADWQEVTEFSYTDGEEALAQVVNVTFNPSIRVATVGTRNLCILSGAVQTTSAGSTADLLTLPEECAPNFAAKYQAIANVMVDGRQRWGEVFTLELAPNSRTLKVTSPSGFALGTQTMTVGLDGLMFPGTKIESAIEDDLEKLGEAATDTVKLHTSTRSTEDFDDDTARTISAGSAMRSRLCFFVPGIHTFTSAADGTSSLVAKLHPDLDDDCHPVATLQVMAYQVESGLITTARSVQVEPHGVMRINRIGGETSVSIDLSGSYFRPGVFGSRLLETLPSCRPTCFPAAGSGSTSQPIEYGCIKMCVPRDEKAEEDATLKLSRCSCAMVKRLRCKPQPSAQEGAPPSYACKQYKELLKMKRGLDDPVDLDPTHSCYETCSRQLTAF